MELRHIRYFLAIAETGSFTRAAEKLGIAQPPLSQQIKVMEQELGVRVFRRLSHGVELTPAGLAFRTVIDQIPTQVENGVRQARRAAAGEVGVLRIGLTGTAALSPIVPTCIRNFGTAYPDVELLVTEANSVALTAALLSGELDVAMLRPIDGGTEGLSEEVLVMEPLIVALPAAHPLASENKAVELAALKGDRFILTPRSIGISLHDAVLDACRKAGFSPRLGPAAPHIVSILSLVAADLGVSLVPQSVAHVGMHNTRLLPLRDAEMTKSIAVSFRRGAMSQAARNFLDIARASRADIKA